MSNPTKSPTRAYTHNLVDDVAEFRRVYRRLVAETRQSPGSGRLCAELGWEDARYAVVESEAYVGDIVYQFFERPNPNAKTRHPIPPQVRAEVWDKTGGVCWYCGCQTNPFRDFTVDHMHPVARGGTDDIDNLVPACRSCNSAKGCRV